MEENKYLLTMMVAKRAKQLKKGAKPLVKTKNSKPILIALQEISEKKVYLKESEESKYFKENDDFKDDNELNESFSDSES